MEYDTSGYFMNLRDSKGLFHKKCDIKWPLMKNITKSNV